jgi:hypothetical protein
MPRRSLVRLAVAGLAGFLLVAAIAYVALSEPASAGGGSWRAWAGSAPAQRGALVVTRGGRYTGTWTSDDVDVAAVTVRTTEPVELADCRITGRGVLVSAPLSGSDVTIRHCTASAIEPGVAGRSPGRFVKAYRPRSLRVEHNRLDGTAGVYVNGDAIPGTRVVVRFNEAVNIDGRRSDGQGGWQREVDLVQFVQFDKVRACTGCEIAWNRVTNAPGSSRVEDNINLYLSSGTPGSPIRVTDNLIDGAWPADPVSPEYSGGGIIVDGSRGDDAPVSAHVVVSGNTVVATTNYGIAVAAGRDVRVEGNRVVSSGLLPDGREVPAANVGAYVWDVYRGGPRREFDGHRVTDNDLGWINAKRVRNDHWFPDCAAPACEGNRHLDGAITPDVERREVARWEERAAAAGVAVGPASR